MHSPPLAALWRRTRRERGRALGTGHLPPGSRRFDAFSPLSWKFGEDDRIPTHPDRLQDRLDTYVDWPLDGLKGSKCTSAALARAGFTYTPEEGGADTVTCFYCDRALSGWEKGDDPMYVHSEISPIRCSPAQPPAKTTNAATEARTALSSCITMRTSRPTLPN